MTVTPLIQRSALVAETPGRHPRSPSPRDEDVPPGESREGGKKERWSRLKQAENPCLRSCARAVLQTISSPSLSEFAGVLLVQMK